MSSKVKQKVPSITFYTCSLMHLMLHKYPKCVKSYQLRFDSDTFIDFRSFRIIGSCHGLCCIEVLPCDIILWNPSTREVKRVGSSEFNYHVFGFAYDEFIDDYRVVGCKTGGCFGSDIIDYSLRKDSWKRITLQDIKSPAVSRYCPSVGGNLHWLLEYDNALFALSYDLKTETSGLIKLPHNIRSDGNGFEPVTLGVLRGCLCMVLWCHYSITIWMMKDYGVHESWSKVASYSGEQRLSWSHLIWSPPGHEDDGNNILLCSSNRLGLFRAEDVILEEQDCMCSCFDGHTFEATHYVESLVSPLSSRNISSTI